MSQPPQPVKMSKEDSIIKRNNVGCCGFATITTNRTGILEKFGKFVKLVNPGLTCYWCCCESIYEIANNVRHHENKTATKTKDDVIVVLVTSVQYKIDHDDTQTAFYSLENPETQIESYIDNCIRSHVPNLTLDELFQSKDSVNDEVKRTLSSVMTNFGFTIINTLLTDICIPAKVQAAMNSKNENSQLRVAAAHKAEADKITVVTASEASASQILTLAKAQAEADILKGQGIGKQREIIVGALDKAALDLSKSLRIGSEDAVAFALTCQYFDTLKEIGSRDNRTLILPYSTNVNDTMKNIMLTSSLDT